MIIVGMLLHIQVYMDSKCTNVHVHGIKTHFLISVLSLNIVPRKS